MNEEELGKLKADIKDKLNELKNILPKRVDPAFISHKSKIPYKVFDARASLMWRSYELGKNAFQLLSTNNIASGVLLTRAYIETLSMSYYLHEKINNLIKNENVSEFDDVLMNILLGSRNKTTKCISVNTLTTINRMDKVFNGFKTHYDLLSEYAHPNYSGTHGLFAKINYEEFYTDYDNNIKNDKILFVSLKTIYISIVMMIDISTEIYNLSESFIKICDKDNEENIKT